MNDLKQSPPSAVESLYWLLVGVRDVAYALFGVAISVTTAIWTGFGMAKMWTWPAIVWLIAVILMVALWAVGSRTFLRPTYKTVMKDKTRAEDDLRSARRGLQGALDSLLCRVLDEFKLGDDTGVRISAYSVEDGEFVLLSRQSKNPVLERRGRPSYSLHQGVIGHAWERVSALQNDESANRAQWEQTLVADEGFTRDEAAALTMHARSICAVRAETQSRPKAGMVVLESEKHGQFTAGTIQKLRRSHVFNALVDVLGASHSIFPRALERTSERKDGDFNLQLLEEPLWKNAR